MIAWKQASSQDIFQGRPGVPDSAPDADLPSDERGRGNVRTTGPPSGRSTSRRRSSCRVRADTAARCTSRAVRTGVPSASSRWSPGRNPARAAVLSGVTASTAIPSASASGRRVKPRRARGGAGGQNRKSRSRISVRVGALRACSGNKPERASVSLMLSGTGVMVSTVAAGS